MGNWGPGLMQSDDDYEIAKDLSEMCGCQLIFEEKDEHKKEDTVRILNSGLFSKQLDKILSANFQPRTSHHKRERVAVIFGMLAMQLGVKLESHQWAALQVLRPWLPTMEQQLQLFTALDEYKNDGTPWVTGSKNLAETKDGKTNIGLSDPFWYGGLGHSVDEEPIEMMHSKVCLGCGKDGPDLRHCARCKMARYCNRSCQRFDWALHKKVCEVHESIRVSSTKEKLEDPLHPNQEPISP